MDLFPASSVSNVQPDQNGSYLTDLQHTSGMNGARSIITRPSSRIVVFDHDDDLMYIIATDINNNKDIKRFRFYEEPEPKPEDIFASKEEINELKGEMQNVQQSIRDLTIAVTKAINSNTDDQLDNGSTNGNKKFVQKPKGDNKPNGTFANSNGQ